MTEKKRILHITNWYPNVLDTIDAQFIKDQIDALNAFWPSDVMLIQVRKGPFKMFNYASSAREHTWIIQLPFTSWILNELLSSFMLLIFLLFKYDKNKYAAINFHIAYPLLTYFHLYKRLIRVPVIISEHWSAYHFNFGVQKELPRIKRIFRHQSNLITVSRSLANDIEKFSGCNHLKTFILPNRVNEKIFYRKKNDLDVDMKFFMLACWQYPKTPWVVINALKVLREKGFSFQARIGGYGPYEERLKKMIIDLNLQDCIMYIGKQTFEQCAFEMRSTSHFLHASEYETFSIVCAEALCCGVPVVASAVGGIPDFVTDVNGLLVKHNNIEDWTQALMQLYKMEFNSQEISDEAIKKFAINEIGKLYCNIINQIVKD